ncbi:MAG: tetratricopeptide repeat protein [Chloroflexota bacterium]|nr:tetratricopeptide repeat protein [Chloroflexota bacterium]
MADRFLSERYAYRDSPPDPVPRASAREAPAEVQAHAHVLRGNQAFAAANFAEALTDYRRAWALLPTLVGRTWSASMGDIEDTSLLAVDLFDVMVSASIQILRLREAAGPEVPIVAAIAPPAEFWRLGGDRGRQPRPSDVAYEFALGAVRAGELDVARQHLATALWRSRRHPSAQADARNLAGVLATVTGDLASGQDQFQAAAALYRAAGSADGEAATKYNAGVVAALAGDFQAAWDHLIDVAHAPFLGMTWQLSRSTLPGVASFSLLIDAPGLPLMTRAEDGRWQKVSSAGVAPPRAEFRLALDGAVARVDLEHGRDAALVASLFERRVQATTLAALDTRARYLPSFIAHLAHVQGFMLPLALGETYAALGDDERAEAYLIKARDYRYLNRGIERPYVWRTLATVYRDRGRSFFLNGRLKEARSAFSRMAPPGPFGGPRSSSPLYSGAFADVGPEARSLLNTDDPSAHTGLGPGSQTLLLDAVAHLHRLDHAIDRFGLMPRTVGAGPWRALQRTARTMARRVRQVESIADAFELALARGELTRATLDHFVNAHTVAVGVEAERLREAEAALAIARTGAAGLETRQTAVRQTIERFEGSPRLRQRLSLRRGVGARRGETPPLGVTPASGSHAARVRPSAGHGQASRNEELSRLREQTAWLTAARSSVERQADVARRLANDATNQLNVARSRLETARRLADSRDGQPLTSERLATMRQMLREVRGRGMEVAVGAIELMETVVAFAPGAAGDQLPVGNARREERFAELSHLLADLEPLVDQERPLEPSHLADQRLPMRLTFSLAERWPCLFAGQFWETGRIEFETLLADIDRFCPGTCMATLRQVTIELDTEDVTARCHATLTRSGIGSYRDRDGTVRFQARAPERLAITNYGARLDDAGAEALSFTPRDAFAGAPVAGGWVFEVAPTPDHLAPGAIADIKLALDFDAYHDQALVAQAAARPLLPEVNEHALGFWLKARFPNPFSLLRTTGAVSFPIDPLALPGAHAEPRLVDAYVLIDAGPAAAPHGLVLTIGSATGGVTAEDTVDPDGLIQTKREAAPLNALRGQHLVDTWTVRCDRDRNAAIFAAGFTWADIQDIHFLADYSYTVPEAVAMPHAAGAPAAGIPAAGRALVPDGGKHGPHRSV